MKTIYKFALIIVVPLFIFGSYLYKYHVIAIEGWSLFNDRCNNINPSLIKAKKQHIYLSSIMAGTVTLDNPEDIIGEIEKLGEYSRAYMLLEDGWIKKQSGYINRWDFKLIEPEYVKKAGYYQVLMYQSYRDYYEAISDVLTPADQKKEKNIDGTEAYNRSVTSKENINKYRQLYSDAFDEGVKTVDFRKMFGRVPEPDCPEENLNIDL